MTSLSNWWLVSSTGDSGIHITVSFPFPPSFSFLPPSFLLSPPSAVDFEFLKSELRLTGAEPKKEETLITCWRLGVVAARFWPFVSVQAAPLPILGLGLVFFDGPSSSESDSYLILALPRFRFTDPSWEDFLAPSPPLEAEGLKSSSSSSIITGAWRSSELVKTHWNTFLGFVQCDLPSYCSAPCFLLPVFWRGLWYP